MVEEKHLSLFEKMLASIDYPDHKVAKLMKEGFPLVGDLDVTGVFETRMPEDIVHGADPELLLGQAEEIQVCVEEQVAWKPSDDLARAVCARTVTGTHKDPQDSEVKKKWLIGPLSENEVTKFFGHSKWVPAPRFGVPQGVGNDGDPRVRPIDDFSIMFHNSCVTCEDKILVSGVDGIASFVKLWADLIAMAKGNPAWAFSVKLSNGQRL